MGWLKNEKILELVLAFYAPASGGHKQSYKPVVYVSIVPRVCYQTIENVLIIHHKWF